MKALRTSCLLGAAWAVYLATPGFAQDLEPASYRPICHTETIPGCNTKIVVEVPPPEVVCKPGSGGGSAPADSDNNDKRCCLFKRKHHDQGNNSGAVANFLYTPAVLPSGGASSPAPSASGSAIDLTQMRLSHDVEARIAALNAYKAARDSELESTQAVLDRSIKSLQSTSGSISSGSRANLGKKSDGTGAVDPQQLIVRLNQINDRLETVEKVLQEHAKELKLRHDRPAAADKQQAADQKPAGDMPGVANNPPVPDVSPAANNAPPTDKPQGQEAVHMPLPLKKN